MMKNLVASNKISFERFKTEFETVVYAKMAQPTEKSKPMNKRKQGMKKKK